VNGTVSGDVPNDASAGRTITATTVNGRVTVTHLR
jgi:hypothetical protein